MGLYVDTEKMRSIAEELNKELSITLSSLSKMEKMLDPCRSMTGPSLEEIIARWDITIQKHKESLAELIDHKNDLDIIARAVDYVMSSSLNFNPYRNITTSQAPQLIVILLDRGCTVSDDQQGYCRESNDIVRGLLTQMVYRSTRSGAIRPRYSLCLCMYSDSVIDVYDGIKTIDEVAKLGLPKIEPTAYPQKNGMVKAFKYARNMIFSELRSWPNEKIERAPAPILINITSEKNEVEDIQELEHLIRTISELFIKDGFVLIEHVLIDPLLKDKSVINPHFWIREDLNKQPSNDFGTLLMNTASKIPESYTENLRDNGFSIPSDALLVFPPGTKEIVFHTFAMPQVS